jgi:hypothetical protein
MANAAFLVLVLGLGLGSLHDGWLASSTMTIASTSTSTSADLPLDAL